MKIILFIIGIVFLVGSHFADDQHKRDVLNTYFWIVWTGLLVVGALEDYIKKLFDEQNKKMDT